MRRGQSRRGRSQGGSENERRPCQRSRSRGSGVKREGGVGGGE
jgi:hypothetical protein